MGPRGDAPYGPDYVYVTDQEKNIILHSELDHTLCTYFLSVGLCVLLTRRRRREDDYVYFYLARVGCVLAAGV